MPRKPSTTPRKQPRQARAVVTVDALVQAVERILAREGLEALTAARVAEVAGVSVGSLYQYFPGKEAIFAELAERYLAQFFDSFAQALRASVDAPLPAVIEAIVRALLGVYRVQARIQPILYDAFPALGLTPRLLALLDRYTVEVARFLAARSDVAVADPQAAAWVLVHAMEGLIRRYGTAGPAAADEPRYFAEVLRLLVGFVSAPVTAP